MSKLKTLKDIEEEFRKFFKWVWQLSPHNFERMIKGDSPDDLVKNFIKYKLQFPAIKWVKEGRKNLSTLDNPSQIVRSIEFGVSQFIKDFFNITEEDLK